MFSQWEVSVLKEKCIFPRGKLPCSVVLSAAVFSPTLSEPSTFKLCRSSSSVLGMFCLKKNIFPCISSIGVIKYRDQDKFKWKSLFVFMVPEGES